MYGESYLDSKIETERFELEEYYRNHPEEFEDAASSTPIQEPKPEKF